MARISNVNIEETRGRILDSFIRLAASIGISNITLQKVAKEAKLSFTTVRYHFNQQGLALETEAANYVLRHGQQFTSDFVIRSQNKKNFDPVEAYVRATFAWVEEHRHFATYLLYFYYLSATQTDLNVRNKDVIKIARARTLNLLRESKGMGLHRKEPEPKLAATVHSILFGSAVLSMALGTKKSDPNPEDICIKVINQVLEQ